MAYRIEIMLHFCNTRSQASPPSHIGAMTELASSLSYRYESPSIQIAKIVPTKIIQAKYFKSRKLSPLPS
jgi:hypothetical protein